MADRALVLLKPQFLGDAVMACPLIDAVSAAHLETIVMCGPMVEAVLADRRGHVSFARGEKISGLRPVLQAARQIRSLDVQRCFLVNRSFRSALALRLAGVLSRIGHGTEGRSFLLTSTIPYDAAKFEAECYLDLARAGGLKTGCPRPSLSLLAGERATVEADFGVQPGARYAEKQVPTSVMREVVQRLMEEGRRPVVLGGPDEVAAATEFARVLGVESLAGKLSIRQTMAQVASLRLMLGSDTGLMHIAAAVGTPTVTVFGPNPASKWGHDYAPHRVIQAPDGDVTKVAAEVILGAIRPSLQK